MTTLVVDIWSRVQENLVGRIGAQRFNLWLKNTALKSLEGDVAVIGVPNPFILAWIEQRLADVIADALSEAAQRRVSIKLVVDGALFRQMRSAQADQQDEEITVKTAGGKVYSEKNPLNPRYTFERYVVGAGNHFAYEMTRQLVEDRGAQFNALVIYGGVGLGKSHLLQAFAKEFSERHPNLGVRYVTCEQFVNRFVSAVRQNGLDSFRRIHRETDALVIDDIHWLADKKASQEEFLHTFNALADRNRIIVAASDSHPSQIKKISRALTDRFAAGMTARLEPPDHETKIAIIVKRLAEMRRKYDAAVIEFLADSCNSNIRELEGSLLKVIAFHSLHKGELTVALARTIVEADNNAARGHATLEGIEKAVCEAFGITAREMKSPRRTRSIMEARQVGMYLARRLTTYSLKEVGAFFGNKSHATALHAEVKIRQTVSKNPSMAELVRKIEGAVMRR